MEDSPTPTDLLSKAEEILYTSGDFGTSSMFYERAIKIITGLDLANWLISKENTASQVLLQVAESYGVACLNSNEAERARDIFKRIVIFDDASLEAHLCLAQLLEGKEALERYKWCLEKLPCDSDVSQRSSIYCSIAELYLSDLCFESKADEQCLKALSKAHSLTPKSFEVSQLFCSYFISKKDNTKAKEYILFTLNRLELDDVEETVPFEFKVQTARLLLELKENLKAIDVLIKLIEEDDEIVELWLLLTKAYIEVEERGAAEQSAEYCQKLLNKFLKVDENNAILCEQKKRLSEIKESL